MLARQLDLLGTSEPRFDPSFEGVRRDQLSPDAWVDHAPGWLSGHDTLFDRLERRMTWQGQRRVMYQREVDVPRLFATPPEDGPGDPILSTMAHALSRRYRRRLDHLLLALYRDGRDSVAWHGDRVGRAHPDSPVAIVSLGGVRPFSMRRAGGGPSRIYSVGRGDLLVMGGSCQRDWEHCVAKVARAAPRIAVMFRQTHT
jgi:alkylated DNA repair dioxygenase AlkB